MDSKEESLKLRSEFNDCQKMLTAIGDETRQHLIALMIMEKCSGARVVDIAKKTNLSRPAVSHHMQILKDAGFVYAHKEGTMVYYSAQMADTWTPIFDLSTPEKVAKYTKNTEDEIRSVIRSVKERSTNRYMSPRTPAFITEWIAEPIYNSKVRRTMNFHVEDTCIGCGLCAKKCPVQAIEIQDKRPVWIKDKCVMCLGCLHRCPKFAIQYGKNTKKHGQYTNPNVKV